MFPARETTILETTESDKIDWAIRYEDERITISRWPEAKHYYLCSNRNRMFVPDKYNEYADALKAARRYVPAGVRSDPAFTLPEGGPCHLIGPCQSRRSASVNPTIAKWPGSCEP